MEQEIVGKVTRLIREDDLIRLAGDLVSYPSPTGREDGIGDFILDWFDKNGVKNIRQDMGEGRMNVIGILEGTGGGVSLSFNGHMDVPYSGDEEDLLYMKKELFERPAHKPKAFVKNEWIYGLGVGNMKAGLAAMMTAVKAVKESGVPLKGDLIAAIVVGEIGRAPVGRFQGLQYEGSGFGTRYLLTHGIHSDYGICVDNSGLKVTWVQPGLVSLLITVYGLPGGAWATGSTISRQTSQNAIIKMLPVIDAVEQWSVEHSKKRTYKCLGGTVIPSAHITSIEAGTPYKASMRPGVCRISVIAMIPPDVKPLDIVKEMKGVIKSAGVDAEVEMYRSCLGFEAQGTEELVKALEENYAQLFGVPLEICDPPYCSVWTDTSTYNEMGIPCVKIGVGMSAADRLTRGIDAYDSHPIGDMVKAAKLYACTALDICSRTALPEK